MDNKHRAMLDYLAQYPGLDAFLHFNTVTDREGNVGIQTVSSNEWESQDITGHGMKRYDFAILYMAPQDAGTSGVNVDQMERAERFMRWIRDQEETQNYPDFEGCQVQSIETIENMPSLAGVNAAGNVAKYMFQCRVRYYE